MRQSPFMRIAEDKKGLALFLVPALAGWVQIIVTLVAHLTLGDSSGLWSVGSMVLFIVVMAVLVARDSSQWGISGGGFAAFVVVFFVLGYPIYMHARGRRGGALGGGAGILGLFLFFLPLLVLPLGAQVLKKKLAAREASQLAVTTSPPPASSSAAGAVLGDQVVCDTGACTVGIIGEVTKAKLGEAANKTKMVTMKDPTPESLASLSQVPWITRLYLGDAKRIDDLSPLAGLVDLEELHVWNARMKTLAPLASLVQLEKLELANAGQLVDLGAIASMANLKTLDINANSVTDLTPIGGASHLRDVSLFGGRGSLEPLAKLSVLQSLSVAGASGPPTDIAPITGLVSLRKLNVHWGHLSDEAPLAKMTGLESLELHGEHLTTLAPLAELKQLRLLDVDDNIDIKDLTPVKGMTALTDLEASGTSVADLAPLAGCTHLSRLGLKKTEIKVLTPLLGLHQLSSIMLDGTEVKDLMPLSKVPSLTRVTVVEGQIPDAAMAAFKAAAPKVVVYVSKKSP